MVRDLEGIPSTHNDLTQEQTALEVIADTNFAEISDMSTIECITYVIGAVTLTDIGKLELVQQIVDTYYGS